MTIYLKKYVKSIIYIIPTVILSIILLINIGCFVYVESKVAIGFIEINRDINQMKKVENLKLKLGGYSELYGYFYTLNDNGVKYIVDNDIPEEKMLYKYCWRIGVEAREELY